jgi:hypothetical protein
MSFAGASPFPSTHPPTTGGGGGNVSSTDGEYELLKLLFLDDDDEESDVCALMYKDMCDADDDEDDEEEAQEKKKKKTRRGGSDKDKNENKRRNFDRADKQLREHYFSGALSLYDEKDFERRFGLPRDNYVMVYETLKDEPVFRRRTDCTGKKGITTLCRLTACMRYLVYGTAADREDEYLQLSETVVTASVKQFTQKVIQYFGAQYLNRCPTAEEKKGPSS